PSPASSSAQPACSPRLAACTRASRSGWPNGAWCSRKRSSSTRAIRSVTATSSCNLLSVGQANDTQLHAVESGLRAQSRDVHRLAVSAAERDVGDAVCEAECPNHGKLVSRRVDDVHV